MTRVFSSSILSLHFCNGIIKKSVTFRAMDIQVLDHSAESQGRFDLYINSFLLNFFEVDNFLILLFYLNFNRRLEAFLEIADHSKLIGGFNRLKFYQNKVKVLEVGYLVLNLFQLILEVSHKLTSNIIYEDLKTSETLLKKAFKIWPRDKNGALWWCLCWAHLRLMKFRKNAAANKVKFIPIVPDILK